MPGPPPEFESPELKDHTIVKKWKEKGFADMDLLNLSQKFLQAYRKDKVSKDKAAVKAAKKLKLPIPEPEPEAANPGIDEPCFTKLLTKQMKLIVPDSASLFKAANTSRSGLMNFSEFVAVIATLSKNPRPAEEKLALVFAMYDKDKDGNLESGDVKLLLEAGLESMPGEVGAKQTQVDTIMQEMKSQPDTRPKWSRRGYSKEQLKGALADPKVYQTMKSGDDGIGESGITEDQLFEATVIKSSRLCVIL
mmetsp:Transcript_62855/g.124098  ORF Transcript_62855/g.124098 Transcript_62855/m.124098 type:complete len:250 (-) Transcript_62855:203-952(-)